MELSKIKSALKFKKIKFSLTIISKLLFNLLKISVLFPSFTGISLTLSIKYIYPLGAIN